LFCMLVSLRLTPRRRRQHPRNGREAEDATERARCAVSYRQDTANDTRNPDKKIDTWHGSFLVNSNRKAEQRYHEEVFFLSLLSAPALRLALNFLSMADRWSPRGSGPDPCGC